MKKLERLDGKLFESLKLSEMSNLASMVGGLCKETQGTLKIQQGNTLYTKNYLDKQNGIIDSKGVWLDDGCSYDWVIYKAIGGTNPDLISADMKLTDLTIND